MNYIKKIKSLGFKKVPSIVVCEYDYSAKKSGKYIELESKYMDDRRKSKLPDSHIGRTRYSIRDCQPSAAIYNKSYTYQCKLSESITLYILVVKGEFTLVVKDDNELDICKYNTIVKNNVYIPIHSNKICPNFWKDVLNSLDKRIQREILIKNILK